MFSWQTHMKRFLKNIFMLVGKVLEINHLFLNKNEVLKSMWNVRKESYFSVTVPYHIPDRGRVCQRPLDLCSQEQLDVRDII